MKLIFSRDLIGKIPQLSIRAELSLSHNEQKDMFTLHSVTTEKCETPVQTTMPKDSISNYSKYSLRKVKGMVEDLQNFPHIPLPSATPSMSQKY